MSFYPKIKGSTPIKFNFYLTGNKTVVYYIFKQNRMLALSVLKSPNSLVTPTRSKIISPACCINLCCSGVLSLTISNLLTIRLTSLE